MHSETNQLHSLTSCTQIIAERKDTTPTRLNSWKFSHGTVLNQKKRDFLS